MIQEEQPHEVTVLLRCDDGSSGLAVAKSRLALVMAFQFEDQFQSNDQPQTLEGAGKQVEARIKELIKLEEDSTYEF